MRKLARLGLLVIAALVATTPLASAQMNQADTVTEVRIDPVAHALSPDNVSVTKVRVLYTYQMGGFSFSPTEVRLSIVEAPAWVSAVLSPSTVAMPIHQQPTLGSSSQSHAATELALSVSPDAPEHVPGVVRILAEADPNGNMKGSSGEASILVTAVGTEAPIVCDGSEDAADAEDDGLSTQTLGATPGPTLLPIAAAGVVGAVAGLAVARLKARRQG